MNRRFGDALSVLEDKCAYERIVKPWAQRIQIEDPRGWAEAGGDVYRYLVIKAKQNNMKKSRNGSAQNGGWAFVNAHPDKFVKGVIVAKGQSCGEQSQPYRGPEFGDTIWPCVILYTDCGYFPLVPFYCPVLGINGSRAWQAHLSRVFRITWPQFPVAPPPPGPPPGHSGIIHTQGPTIEEVEEVDDVIQPSDSASNVGFSSCGAVPPPPPPGPPPMLTTSRSATTTSRTTMDARSSSNSNESNGGSSSSADSSSAWTWEMAD